MASSVLAVVSPEKCQPAPADFRPVATREALQRWRSVLLDIERLHTLPSGQKVRSQLGSPQARANFMTVNAATPIYGMVTGTLTTLFTDLRGVDPPTDPALAAVLEPVWQPSWPSLPTKNCSRSGTTLRRLCMQLAKRLRRLRWASQRAPEIITEMLLSLKTTLLIAGLGRLGSMTVLAQELVRRYTSFAAPVTVPLRFYDLATNAMVDSPSSTTLSLAAIKAMVVRRGKRTTSGGPPPSVSKQFAAQVVVDFYTDWEEYYRPELAKIHQCSKYDFRINYFGDLGKMRHDYVHNRGVCSNSAHCDLLKWFTKGDLLIPTPENYLQLLTDFPADELQTKPQPVVSGRGQVQGIGEHPDIARIRPACS